MAEAHEPCDAEELVRNADAAMYIAKSDGKGSYRLFEPAMHERVVARLELRADLQRAVHEDQFILHYQPIVRLSTGHLSGFEALVRWRHPRRGLLMPDTFLPLCEEMGLMEELGAMMMRTSAKQLAAVIDQLLPV